MKVLFVRALLVFFFIGGAITSSGQNITAPIPPPDAPAPARRTVRKFWSHTGPLPETIQRTSDSLPLSDQGNKGKWVKNEPLWDEFEGTSLDTTKWYPKDPHWNGDRAAGRFVAENAEVTEGELNIWIKKERQSDWPENIQYTTTSVKNRQHTLYGYYEIEFKAADADCSSAFWLFRDEEKHWTEIDVFEILPYEKNAFGGGFHEYYMTLHIFKLPENDGKMDHRYWQSKWVAPWRWQDTYHVAGLEWDEKEIKWYLDGHLIKTVENTFWHQPLDLTFDSEIWAPKIREDNLPAKFSIKYSRAWKKSDLSD